MAQHTFQQELVDQGRMTSSGWLFQDTSVL